MKKDNGFYICDLCHENFDEFSDEYSCDTFIDIKNKEISCHYHSARDGDVFSYQNNEFDNLSDICDDCISELIILGKIKFKQRYF